MLPTLLASLLLSIAWFLWVARKKGRANRSVQAKPPATATVAVFHEAAVPLDSLNMTDSHVLFRGRRPAALRFGTSGLRGLVTDITDLEAYINTCGFLDFLHGVGDVKPHDTVCVAGDLRPSTDSPQRSIMRAVARAVADTGLEVENLGRIPAPALTYYGLQMGRASVMVTGSHIPFDRNGIKFNKKSGEVLKEDEPGILEAVARVRREEYERPVEESLFDDQGAFKAGKSLALPPINEEAQRVYLKRYTDFFPPRALEGRRVVFFQHSAVGRDLLTDVLRELGADVHALGRSDEFIAIDTEYITDERLRMMQQMVDDVGQQFGPVDALVSTDGDSDRPLLLGVEPEGRVRFFGGDLLGIIVAEYLEAESVSIPISANDAVDLQLAKRGVELMKTQIGSPYVIKSMQGAAAETSAGIVVGWEANGGFLTGSLIERKGRTLEPLPTRDAALPLLSCLHATVEQNCTVVDLFSRLPPRFSKAGLIDDFPREVGMSLVQQFSPEDERVQEVKYDGDAVTLTYREGHTERASMKTTKSLRRIREELRACFKKELGFDAITRINVIDGLRVYFANGEIAHIRPSGNAPQLRIYVVADTPTRAEEIVRLAVEEPRGLLRQLEAAYGRG
jgi:phosphomannomutase